MTEEVIKDKSKKVHKNCMYRNLKEALKEAYDTNVCVFAKQISLRGERNYYVLSQSEFYSYYKELPESERKYYEIIMTERNMRLFMDIEYSRASNPTLMRADENFLKDIVNKITTSIKSIMSIEVDANEIIVLTSHSHLKFSAHLVFLREALKKKRCPKLRVEICILKENNILYFIIFDHFLRTDLF